MQQSTDDEFIIQHGAAPGSPLDLNTALDGSTTWGEFRQSADPIDYEAIRDSCVQRGWVFELPDGTRLFDASARDDYMAGNDGEEMLVTEATSFSGVDLPGNEEAGLYTIVGNSALGPNSLPQVGDLFERLGSLGYSALDGAWWSFPESARAGVRSCLEGLGYTVSEQGY